MDYEGYKVFSVGFNAAGSIKIDYSITPEDGPAEHCVVSRADAPHQDFFKIWREMETMAKQQLGLGYTNVAASVEGPMLDIFGNQLNFRLLTIKFLTNKDKGFGLRMTITIDGFEKHDNQVRITLPAFWVIGEIAGKNQLSNNEISFMERMKEEAFKFAYYGKRLQPTVDEAADAAENGGFTDERVSEND